MNQSPHQTHYLELITGLFTGLLIISNIASTRLIEVGPLTFDAGTLMFPFTYIFGDLLTEVYGFAQSRKVIWTGFLALFLGILSLYLVSLFPTPPDWLDEKAWDQVMGLTPRIALGSLAAYLLGEFANSITLSKMKSAGVRGGTGWRFIASTMVGQVIDTLIFASIAFIGVIDWSLWVKLVLSNYIFKVCLEVILLPLTLMLVRHIKKVEGLDTVDRDIHLNPFFWKQDKIDKK